MLNNKPVALAGFACISALAQAADWAPPFRDADPAVARTVAGSLEDKFSELLTTCSISVPLRKATKNLFGAEKLTDEISSIPRDLQAGALPLKAHVVSIQPNSAARLFAYLYEEQETKGDFTLAPQRLLTADYVQDAAEFLLKGGVDAVYKQTCSSVISAATNVGFDWSMPGAALNAALSAEHNAGARTVFLLTSGLLRSPLERLLTSDSPYSQLQGGLVFWQWYAANPAHGNYQYLTDVQSVALYQYLATDTKTNGAIKLRGGGSGFGLNATADLAASVANEWSLQVNQSTTYLLARVNSNRWGEFKNAPSEADVMKFAAKATPQTQLPSSVIAPGIEYVHTLLMPALQGYCDTNLWEIDYPLGGDRAAGTMAIKSAELVPPSTAIGSVGACSFKVGFIPAGDVPANVSLKYHLRYKAAVNGQYISLTAGPIDLATTTAPSLRRQSDRAGYVVENKTVRADGKTDSNLLWMIRYLVKEDENFLTDGKSPDTDTVAISCPGNLHPFVNQKAIYDTGTKTLTLELRAQVAAEDARDVDGTVPPIHCNVTGTADFHLQKATGGVRVLKRPVGDGVTLFYPAASPSAAH